MSAEWVYKKPPETPLYPRILTFHKLLSGISFGSTNYSPRRFGKLLLFLNDNGVQLVSLEKALQEKKNCFVAITFDDGYRHLVDILPELMLKLGFIPTVFILTGYIGQTNKWDYTHFIKVNYHLDIQSIKKLARSGVEFGTHGHRHLDLTACSLNQLNTELIQSKKILEDIIENEITSISYPFGRYDERVIEATLKAGYKYGFTMAFPEESDNDMTLGRIPVYSYDSRLAVFQKVYRGPLYRWEKLKADFTHRMASGTIMLNKIRSYK